MQVLTTAPPLHAGMRTFELELRWTSITLAATLGTLRVQLPEGEELCATTLEILQATAEMLQVRWHADCR